MNFIIDSFTWIVRLVFGLLVIVVGCVPSWLLWRNSKVKALMEKPETSNSNFRIVVALILTILIIFVLPVFFVLSISLAIDPTGQLMQPIFSILETNN